MRSHNWPGLALAGGVVIAAVIALLVIGGGGGSGHGSLAPGTGPGDTRLFRPAGQVAAHTAPVTHRQAQRGPTSDAAVFQYDASATRGTVLGDP